MTLASVAPPRHRTNVRDLTMPILRTALRLASALAPAATARWAEARFLRPLKFEHSAGELQALSHGHRFTIASGGKRLVAWSFGSPAAPIVVMSHGWSGRGAQFRSFVEPLLREGFRVVLFDHPSHGFSEGRSTSLIEFAEALGSVCAHLVASGGRLHGLVGHSFGSPAIGVALKQAGIAAERVVLLAPPASLLDYSRRFAQYLGLSERVRERVASRLERRLGVPLRSLELPEAVAGIEAEALIIHDKEDAEVPFHEGEKVARSWPKAQLLTTRGLGHRALLRDPWVIRKTIDFLQAH
jgi:pimeloyl-ACP methyl ester carboxylesterase